MEEQEEGTKISAKTLESGQIQTIHKQNYRKLIRSTSYSSVEHFRSLRDRFETKPSCKIISSEETKNKVANNITSKYTKEKSKSIVKDKDEGEAKIDKETIEVKKKENKKTVKVDKNNTDKKQELKICTAITENFDNYEVNIDEFDGSKIILPTNVENPIPAPRKSLDKSGAIDNLKIEISAINPQIAESVIIFAEPEDRHHIERQSSVDSIDLINRNLDFFEMDVKNKKRSNSFTKRISDKIFGRDRKKNEEKKKVKKAQNDAFTDNAQNENFNRSSNFRQTTDSSIIQNRQVQQRIQSNQQNQTELEKRYAQIHINNFNQAKATFQGPPVNEDYVCMDNNIKTKNYGNIPPNAPCHKFNERSSSSNTLESDTSSIEKIQNANAIYRNQFLFPDITNTPPRAQDTYQNVQLVKPKALIPINSERPLPNPYQEKPRNFGPNQSMRDSPSSPRLECSKLKLPVNREKIELQPRIKSPIPQNEVSTEKIIATELLKNKKRSSPSHQHLGIEIDYPEHFDIHQYKSNAEQKSPKINSREAGEWHKKQRELDGSSSLHNMQVTTNVQVHVDSPKGSTTPVQDLSRAITPIQSKSPTSTSSLQRTPPKHEIRQNVEAYCWKELKKLKEKEDFQTQLLLSSCGYAEDPIITHRSRSMAPTVRDTKRSSSLPRDVMRQRRMEEVDIIRRNTQGRPVSRTSNMPQEEKIFYRNSPQRSTISSFGRQEYPANRPIFNRGSLTQQVNRDQENIYNKKVSFHSPQNPDNPQSWPSKNGFTQSPPQRRIELKRDMSLEDEVFLPNESKLNGDDMYKNNMKRMPNDLRITLNDKQMPLKIFNNEREALYGTRESVSLTRESPYSNREALYGTKEPLYVVKSNHMRHTIDTIKEVPNEQQIYGYTKYNSHNNKTDTCYDSASNSFVSNGSPYSGGSRFTPNESPYGSRNIPLNEPLYVQKSNVYYHKLPVDNKQNIREPIYGSRIHQHPNEIYGMRQSHNESIYGTKAANGYNNYQQQENLYGSRYDFPPTSPPRNKLMTVNNKVCDIYGHIHDNAISSPPPPAQRSGVLYGQLQRNSNAPPIQYQSYQQIQNSNFVRGTRLTASVNDMYKYRNEPPNRPLPPIPDDAKRRLFRRKAVNAPDSESNCNELYRMNHPIIGK